MLASFAAGADYISMALVSATAARIAWVDGSRRLSAFFVLGLALDVVIGVYVTLQP